MQRISEKARGARIRWFGHIVRRKAEEDIRVAYEIEVEDSRLRDRPKKKWRDQLRKDMQEMDIREKEAQDWKHWWKMV